MTELSAIDRILRSSIDVGDLPGVVAVAGTREGPIYQGAAGKRALPAGPDMTVDSVFWIASMTKAITSTAAMQLIERGKLALEAPIREGLPQLAHAPVLHRLRPPRRPKPRPAHPPPTPP